jgi:hypothetical protein
MAEIKVVIGPETVRSYKRLAYEVWWAMAEFVDNSTQSYLSHRNELDFAMEKKNEQFEIHLAYDRNDLELRISDNANGMSLEQLTRAVEIGSPPDDASGRHEFGMGLKTAACWLGDVWTLRTTKLGDPNEYTIEFDVERVASHDTDLRLKTVAVGVDTHYTILTISKMHQQLGGRLLGSLKENLRSIYRFDTRSGMMKLWWGDEELSYDERLVLLKAADGSEYRKDFSFEVNGKTVKGWAGIHERGSRSKAGFAVSRRGRLVMGQPDAWRPRSIFGQEGGSNDLVNQRLFGEIHLDHFHVSHTKNQILWQDDELDQVETQLKEILADYRHTALNRRSRGENGPSEQAQTVAMDAIKEIVTASDFADVVNVTEVPAPEIVEATLLPLRAATHTKIPDNTFVIGALTVKLFMDGTGSSNDPYFLGDYVSDHEVSVCINTCHRFWQDYVTDAQDILIYTLNCIYDAIAEWKCMKYTGEIRPDTVKVIKDAFMRQTFSQA